MIGKCLCIYICVYTKKNCNLTFVTIASAVSDIPNYSPFLALPTTYFNGLRESSQ